MSSRAAAAHSRSRTVLILPAVLLLIVLWAVVMLTVAIPTLFRARGFYAGVLSRRFSQMVLWLLGIRLRVQYHAPIPEGQVVYIANHSSTLDMFVLLALGLPRIRFFMIGKFRHILPIWAIGAVLGTFWTVAQKYPDQRRRIFQRADRILRQTGESVFLSPEGRRVVTGGIGKFNKGSFHLAASLGAPVVPLYIRIPDDVNPWLSYRPAAPGTIEVQVLPAIATSDWRVEDAALHAATTREIFVRLHERAGSAGAPADQQGIAAAAAAADAGGHA
jgi:1-acyl-sn-glycerol-3-phosphate acyltransferase